MRQNNHNTKSKNLKTHFNRERWDHNIEFRKHNIKFSGSGLKLNKSSFIIPSIIFSLVGLTIISGFILSQPSNSTSANAATSTSLASVTVPDVCSLSSSSTNHTDTVNGGSYTTDFGGVSTVTVTCNDRNGYSVYAVGYSNDTEGTTNLIGTSTGLNIPTGTSTVSGSNAVSNWAMKLTAANGSFAPTILSDTNGSFANYHIVPSTVTKVATYTSDINVSNSSQFTTSYAVSVSPTQAADTYVGKVKYTVVHPNYAYSDGTVPYNIITYVANGGSGSINNQIVNTGDSVALADNAFTRTNYYFKGWATSPDAITPTYRTNQSITPTKNMTLYAVWGNSVNANLYDTVASLTRGTQTNDTNAVTGIQTNPTKATSGVYTYDASVFGTSSDASNDNAIYYYRGVLDATLGSYGSDGDAMDYPNYVKLGITCWRIVRTTGSGGVKMIYNGMYGNSKANSCANIQAAAAIRSTSATTASSTTTFTSAFDVTANSYGRSILGAGYTYNASYKTTTTSTAYNRVFGSNTSYSGNSTNATIKNNIETWFTNNLNSYISKLETSAGYCNDRTLYPSGSYDISSLVSDSTTIVPYGTSNMTTYYFGAYARNFNTAQNLTIACPRATADLYTTSGAVNGNKQLSKPVALLTADEMSFAGSGRTSSGYNSKSYLSSGLSFWSLSSYYRRFDGHTYGVSVHSVGFLDMLDLYTAISVRPAISLAPGTVITSGSGTATDPWVVQ